MELPATGKLSLFLERSLALFDDLGFPVLGRFLCVRFLWRVFVVVLIIHLHACAKDFSHSIGCKGWPCVGKVHLVRRRIVALLLQQKRVPH
eukprot:3474063-Amphidinium_carterae.1